MVADALEETSKLYRVPAEVLREVASDYSNSKKMRTACTREANAREGLHPGALSALATQTRKINFIHYRLKGMNSNLLMAMEELRKIQTEEEDAKTMTAYQILIERLRFSAEELRSIGDNLTLTTAQSKCRIK